MSDEGTMTVAPEAVPVERLRSVDEIVADARRIQEVMEKLFKVDVHYGRLPGCGDKPTLLKPGAEKIASTFRIAVDPRVTDLSTPDEIRYRVEARGTSILTGAYLGSGIGECSSNEMKYKWRAAVGREYAHTAEDRKRVKFGKAKDGTQDVEQVRTDPSDFANTIVKMAKKRALVDLVLTATAASDCFTQDLEDFDETARQALSGQESQDGKPAVKPPTRKSEAAPSAPEIPKDAQFVDCYVTAVQMANGTNAKGKPWIRYGVDVAGTVYGTFSETLGKALMDAKEAGTPVRFAWMPSPDGKHRNIVSVGPLDEFADAAAAPREPGSEA